MNLIFITGGARSGKSRYGQEMALKMCNSPIYIATSRIWDEDFKERVKKHQQERNENWKTIEEELKLSSLADQIIGKTILVDCITLWLTNIYHDNQYNYEKSLNNAIDEWKEFSKIDCNCIAISNEIGMGLHGETYSQRKFIDLQGFVNQFIASLSQEAYVMISGIPLKLK